jgi:hypothetical protein
MGAWEDGFAAGYNRARQDLLGRNTPDFIERGRSPVRRKASPLARPVKPKRKASAYSKRYGAAFKRIAPKNKKKGGGWKQGGFMRTQKAAHKAAKK